MKDERRIDSWFVLFSKSFLVGGLLFVPAFFVFHVVVRPLFYIFVTALWGGHVVPDLMLSLPDILVSALYLYSIVCLVTFWYNVRQYQQQKS
jgi:hypothetical protein